MFANPVQLIVNPLYVLFEAMILLMFTKGTSVAVGEFITTPVASVALSENVCELPATNPVN